MLTNLDKIGFYTMSNSRACNASVHSQMQRCEMIITEHCNFHCPYCRGLDQQIYGARRIKQLTLAEICRNIDYWCQGTSLRAIRFSGGEPTLHPNILEVVRYAKEKGIEKIAISTNGSNKLPLYQRLVEAGVNDFSVSLDACCASVGDKMAGGITGAWKKVVKNIEELSKLTYVTVGIVFTLETIGEVAKTVKFAHGLGVADIRVISAAQFNKPVCLDIEPNIVAAHPILAYRLARFAEGKNVRGMKSTDSPRCALVLDDSVIAGDYHFPCVIYMREKGRAIGRVSLNMRVERAEWFRAHNCYSDDICRKNCLDVCIDYNNRWEEEHK